MRSWQPMLPTKSMKALSSLNGRPRKAELRKKLPRGAKRLKLSLGVSRENANSSLRSASVNAMSSKKLIAKSSKRSVQESSKSAKRKGERKRKKL